LETLKLKFFFFDLFSGRAGDVAPGWRKSSRLYPARKILLPSTRQPASHARDFPHGLGGRSKSMTDSIANRSRWDFENAAFVGSE
jgi:hypothetical protein